MPLRRFARSWEGNTGRRRNVSPPLIPRFHGTRSPTLVRDETRRATGPRRGGDSSLDGGKKREREGGREGGRKGEPGFTSRSRANGKRRSRRTRSSTNCLRGTGLGINLLLALCLPCPCPPPAPRPSHRLLYSELRQTSRDVVG